MTSPSAPESDVQSTARSPARGARLVTIAATVGGVIIGLVLLVAAWSKVIDPETFAKSIRAHGLDFGMPTFPLALIAIGIEVGLGVALVLGMRHRPLLLAASGLTLLFLFLTGKLYLYALQGRFDDSPSCGCFGNLIERSPAQAFWQDVLLLVPALALAWLRPTPGTGWRLPRKVLVTFGAAATCAVTFAAFAPGLPLDGLATRLDEGMAFDGICAGTEKRRACLKDVMPIVRQGKHLVVIADLGDEDFRAQVEEMNGYALDEVGPTLWVLTVADSATISRFSLTTGASFTIVSGPKTLVRPLHRRLPRSFLVEDGTIRKTWSGMPPFRELGIPPPG